MASAPASRRPTRWSIRRTTASATFWTATASPILPAALPPRRRCSATSPELYHLDTSRTEAPKARRLAEEIARIVRGRLTNPRWIAGMLGHGHRGVAEIAQAVDALYAFAATARAVPDHLFDATHAALIADEAVRTAMTEKNPAATAAIAARLRDALARGLWTTRRNAVDHELERAILKAGS